MDTVLFVGDVHFPHQEPAAVEVFLRTVRMLRPAAVYVLGDVIDAGRFGRFSKKKLAELDSSYFTASELQPAADFLDACRRYARCVVFIEGNHEARVEQIAAQDPVFRSIWPDVDPRRRLEPHVDVWIPEGGYAQIGSRLLAVHGSCAAKYAAARHLDRWPATGVVYAHCHRPQMHSRRDPRTDDVHVAMGIGCLCKLQPLYMTSNPSDWGQGFGLAYRARGTAPHLYHCLIEHGRTVLPDGREVKA